jgi:hypothetical protein
MQTEPFLQGLAVIDVQTALDVDPYAGLRIVEPVVEQFAATVPDLRFVWME